MKKIFKITVISCFTILSINSFSQGNLQFNRAIMESYTITNPQAGTTSIIDTLIVPSAKVFKVTSVSLSLNYNITKDTEYGNEYLNAFINDHNLITYSPVQSGFSPDNGYSKMPIWLPAGVYIIRFSSTETYSGFAHLSLSGLEFNVTP